MGINQNYWRANLCTEMKPVPNLMVIFGASGDLTKRKLIPALFSLYLRELFHPSSMVVGCARSKISTEEFRNSLKEFFPEAEDEVVNRFLSRIHYLSGDYSEGETYLKLSKKISELEKETGLEALNHTFYLSTPASLYSDIVPKLGEYGLTAENYLGEPWRHVVLEKPFGYDFNSAMALDQVLHKTLLERQIYRIDHYLGKETVQNILMLRFANIIFEPVWNSTYIDHVQITAAESIGVEDRAGYYDRAGALRDMFQNHMLAMLSLVAMEAPAIFDANAMRDEQLKLIKSIRPFPEDELEKYLVRGQYASAGKIPSYLEEPGIAADSTTETYAATKIMIDNWRWHGVPFYLRSGKRLNRKLSEIAITFKRVPHSIFPQLRPEDLEPDILILNVQPQEGMTLSIQAKQPGAKLCMGSLALDFNYSQVFGTTIPDAYERLLLDCMLGDQTLFIRSDVIAASWRLFTPVLEAWQNNQTPLYHYKSGGEGPEEANCLFKGTNACWRPLHL